MEKAKKANVDAVQFFEGFNKLRDEGKITSEERDSIIKLFTSKSSFGPGSIRRNEISYDDLCEGMKEIPTVIQSVYKQATIWDDFYDDDYVPEGQKQETHAYIEDSFFSDDEKELLMMCFHGYLVETFKEELEGVKVIDGGDEIYFKDITHKKLDSIMRKLDSIELTFGGIPYNIYSES